MHPFFRNLLVIGLLQEDGDVSVWEIQMPVDLTAYRT
jgi:hypothetical protein